MPTRKQRRRRDKEKRHEYGYVLVDETGEERELDPAELRAQRTERGKPKDVTATNGKAVTDRRGRKIQPPSWRRAATRAAFFVVVLFLFISLTRRGKSSRLADFLLVGVYGVVSVPLFFWMDRLTYRRWQRQQDGAAAKPPAAKRR